MREPSNPLIDLAEQLATEAREASAAGTADLEAGRQKEATMNLGRIGGLLRGAELALAWAKEGR